MTKFEKINNKTTVGWAYQPNKKLLCHPELVSGSGHRQGARAMKCAAFTLGGRRPLFNTDAQHIPCTTANDGRRPLFNSGDRRTAFTLAEGGRRPLLNLGFGKVAFTLAEVLITLAVIGIVAALTVPNLIYSYKKRVLETRIVHFSSLWQQAFNMSEAENDSSFNWDTIIKDNPDSLLQQYNKYLGKYIKTAEYYKTPKGVAFALNNGSGFHLRKDSNAAECSGFRGCLYLSFCVNYESCKTIKDDVSPTQYADGKKIFSFYETGGTPAHAGVPLWDTRDEHIESCKTLPYVCTSLIKNDGWKIKDDYPVKL